jgi:site-specific recombinase XerD
VVVRRGKGGVQRRVPLTATVRRALREYQDEQPELGEGDPLWVGQRGPLRGRGSVLRMLKKYAWRAELDEKMISPHVLRHTFATRYLAANPGDLRGLAAILGHSNLNTVLVYTYPTTDALATRMERAETV